MTLESFYMVGYRTSYPFLLRTPIAEGHQASQARGEVYEVDDATLARLDHLEGYTPGGDCNEYSRQEIEYVGIGVDGRQGQGQGQGEEEGEKVKDIEGRLCIAYIYLYENTQGIANMKTDQKKFHTINNGDWKGFLESSVSGGQGGEKYEE
jgi:gamma-glutamylcyclotransferase (GGCT)/AIG2-like uncharacterized protein YtfP